VTLMGITVDSNFVIDALRGVPSALAKSKEIDGRQEAKFLSTPVLYEISAGLLFTRSRSEEAAFRKMVSRFAVLQFDIPSAIKAAEMRAELMRLGKVKGHIDVMIAGIASAGGHTLVSRDKDLLEVSASIGLEMETY